MSATFDDLDLLSLRCLMSYLPLQERLRLRSLNRKCLIAIDSFSIHKVHVFMNSCPAPKSIQFNDVHISTFSPFWELRQLEHIKELTFTGNIVKMDLSSFKSLTSFKLNIWDETIHQYITRPYTSLERFVCHNALPTLYDLLKFPNLKELHVCAIMFNKEVDSIFPNLSTLKITTGLNTDAYEGVSAPDEIDNITRVFPNLEYLSVAKAHLKNIAKFVNRLDRLKLIEVADNDWFRQTNTWMERFMRNEPVHFKRKIKIKFVHELMTLKYETTPLEEEYLNEQVNVCKKTLKKVRHFFDKMYLYDWLLPSYGEWPEHLKYMLTLINDQFQIFQDNITKIVNIDGSFMKVIDDLINQDEIAVKLRLSNLVDVDFRYLRYVKYLTFVFDESIDFPYSGDDFPYLTNVSIGFSNDEPVDLSFLLRFKQLKGLLLFNIDFCPLATFDMMQKLPNLQELSVYDRKDLKQNLDYIVELAAERGNENPQLRYKYRFANLSSYMPLTDHLLYQCPNNVKFIEIDDQLQIELEHFVLSSNLI